MTARQPPVEPSPLHVWLDVFKCIKLLSGNHGAAQELKCISEGRFGIPQGSVCIPFPVSGCNRDIQHVGLVFSKFLSSKS